MSVYFALIIFPLISSGQTIISGKVADRKTGAAIPFATVALKVQNRGTNAKENGEFTILSDRLMDTVLVSCVGYYAVAMPLTTPSEKIDIQLEPVLKTLKPVVVRSNWKTIELGSADLIRNHYFSSTGSQSMVARKFTAPADDAVLSKLEIAIGKRGSSEFRIRIFDVDGKTGGPGAEITNTVIDVKAEGGKNSIDLEPYQIQLSSREFFVGIEWLAIPANEYTIYMGDKRNSPKTSLYKPDIHAIKGSGTLTDIWGLYYSGEWKPVYKDAQISLGIFATVKY